MKKSIIFHPLFFAVYPVLYLYSENIQEMYFSGIFIPLGVIIAVFAVFFFGILLVLRDIKKTSVVVSLFIFMIFSYGFIYEEVKLIFKNELIFIFIWGLLFLLFTFFSIRAKTNFKKINQILNIISLCLILMISYNICAYKIKTRNALSEIENKQTVNFSKGNITEPHSFPDIYYFIFDRYADNEILKKVYNYDNSEFTDWLKDKGFYIASESRSNYLVTGLSLASSLNMEYLNDLSKEPGEEYDSWLPLYNIIQGDYQVWKFLKEKGYIYIHSGSWWPPTNKNKTADININLYRTSNFSMILYIKTYFSAVFSKIGLDINLNINKYTYDTIRDQIQHVLKIPDLNSPKPIYFFAHFLTPHDPYVFDENGCYLSSEITSKRSNYENYTRQLSYINDRIEEIIEEIIKKSETPPVIIIQSDEGPYHEQWWSEEKGQIFLPWPEEREEYLRIKTGILNALYLPGIDTSDLYPSFTPVNTFRYIFNKYFGTDFKILPDEVYAHQDNDHPYKFYNITEKVK